MRYFFFATVLIQVALGQGVVIDNINIISMQNEQILSNQSILIDKGQITAIMPAQSFQNQQGYRMIDGKGAYVIPALTDMHMHLISDDRIDPSFAKTELEIPLSYGVTRARIPIGGKRHLEFKQQIKQGELFAPALHVAGHIYGRAFADNILGIKVTTEKEAREAVQRLKKEGYESIKLTFGINQKLFEAIMSESKQLRIPVFGHYPEGLRVENTANKGMHNEHLDQYLESMLPEGMKLRSISGLAFLTKKRDLFKSIENGSHIDLANLTAKHDIWVTPTQSFFIKAFVEGYNEEEFKSQPEYELVSNEVRDRLIPSWYWQSPPAEQTRNQFKHYRDQLILAMNQRGVGLLAGSDSPEGMRLYGIGLHYELQSFVDAGLTPYEALKTATINPARFLAIDDQFGSIKVGKQADLLLLEKNPLEDIKYSLSIRALFYQNTWYPVDNLIERRKKAAQILKSAKPLDNGH